MHSPHRTRLNCLQWRRSRARYWRCFPARSHAEACLAWTREDLVFTLGHDAIPRSNWLVGDVMAVESVARAYARFLDGVDANG
jgi:hypothetical protein